MKLDIQSFRQGISWAQSWTEDPVLCRIKAGRLYLVAASQKRFLASWSWELPAIQDNAFFLIPQFVINTLTTPSAYKADALYITTQKTAVGIVIQQGQQEFRLHYRWTPADFKAPPHFEKMLTPPADSVNTSYMAIADVVHLAIANLGSIDVADGLQPGENAAITIDTPDSQHHYYFDPRLIIRGMEVTRGEHLGFALQPITQKQGILYFTTRRNGYDIHCAIQSSVVENQWAAATTLSIREKHQPMIDGAWILPRRA
jgi:hypothetical protein